MVGPKRSQPSKKAKIAEKAESEEEALGSSSTEEVPAPKKTAAKGAGKAKAGKKGKKQGSEDEEKPKKGKKRCREEED